ncbi:MAG: hypothetical protein HYU57_09380, partial [Micavibrio aeruginosavorus]|nr:hypothetical protein [Micavibrio aeruginosavorus]
LKALRKKAAPSQRWIDAQADCASQKGQWIEHKNYFSDRSDCHYPAGDEGKTCRDGAECEGFCLPVLNDQEREKIHELDMESLVNSSVQRPAGLGKCSAWKNLHGAPLGLVQSGRVMKPYYGELRK